MLLCDVSEILEELARRLVQVLDRTAPVQDLTHFVGDIPLVAGLLESLEEAFIVDKAGSERHGADEIFLLYVIG
jgi:hypothetical protein